MAVGVSLFRSSGWYGVRVRRLSRRYFVLRDVRRHPPLFSERYGYVPFHVWIKVGTWELGWK